MPSPRHFAYKLTPPRPTFFADQSPDEQEVMQRHVAYWSDLLERGTAVAFSPVLDPAGVWGLAVVEVEDAAEVQKIADNDPIVQAEIGTVDIFPMPGAIVRPRTGPA